MGVGAGVYMYDVVKKFTFAISSSDKFLLPTQSELAWALAVVVCLSIRLSQVGVLLKV